MWRRLEHSTRNEFSVASEENPARTPEGVAKEHPFAPSLTLWCHASHFLGQVPGLQSILDLFTAAGFSIREDRSIHDQEYIHFMRQIIGAGQPFTERVGLRLAVLTADTLHRTEYQVSYLQHGFSPLHCRGLEPGDFIRHQDTPPYCCNPMIVAVQYNTALNTTKYRPCIDLSRHVNLAIAHSTVKLDDLTVAKELILPGDYMTSLDMENQYFQVRLHY